MIKSQRLIRLMMVINARKKFTVRELADEFGLSPRTITRDLQELSEIGVPIYTVQGRGGGYRSLQERMLASDFFLGERGHRHFLRLPGLAVFRLFAF
ncbi:HTH domain-containing protein [Paenibacillus sp. P25]|nr:HTH domain-containing protein [Paenibacillus sp. P25]